jgi:hypothetical protein
VALLEAWPALGGLGGGGVLVYLLVHLLGSNRADRAQAIERIKAANDRADAADKRAEDARRAEYEAWSVARDAKLRADRLEIENERLRCPPPPPEGGMP